MSSNDLSLRDGMDRADLDLAELWQRYSALGGNGTQSELSDHVASDRCSDDHEHNLIAQAINEVFLERGENHPVGYRHLYRPPTS
jgi:hypothetical protein